jgi:hypothetical protein
MINLKQAMRSNRVMKALTGIPIEEFKALLPTFRSALQKNKAKQKEIRKRAEGGGRKHTLKSAESKLFFIVFYLKCYPTYDLAAFFFAVNRSQIQRWVKTLLPILQESLAWEVVLPQRKISSVEEFMQGFPGVKDVFIDGTDRPGQRPKKAKSQRQHYSGKQQEHTHKNLVMTDDQGQFLIISQTNWLPSRQIKTWGPCATNRPSRKCRTGKPTPSSWTQPRRMPSNMC